MHAFDVKDMTCGHCASTITKALKAVDQDARVSIDLARHLVSIEPAQADAGELQAAIVEAGYTPVPTQAAAPRPAAAAGSCCGHCR